MAGGGCDDGARDYVPGEGDDTGLVMPRCGERAVAARGRSQRQLPTTTRRPLDVAMPHVFCVVDAVHWAVSVDPTSAGLLGIGNESALAALLAGWT